MKTIFLYRSHVVGPFFHIQKFLQIFFEVLDIRFLPNRSKNIFLHRSHVEGASVECPKRAQEAPTTGEQCRKMVLKSGFFWVFFVAK